MKSIYLLIISMIPLIFFACKSTKKNSSTVATEDKRTTSAATTNTSTTLLIKPASGIYAPGTDELTAIQTRFADIALEKLNEGYILYAHGPCVNCHTAKNVYQYDETRWESIIDKMAPMAKLNTNQKDAVFKYVLAIKASKTNSSK